MAVTAVRGFKDILPADTWRASRVETAARRIFRTCGLQEIRIPILEKTEVFARSIGEHTDIVEKEMYTFVDRSGDSITLRPEATAGLVRAFIEHKLYAENPVLKLFTTGPMFRHERPQKGRLRQFHQINVEVFGADSPLADAEVIWLAWEILNQVGAQDLRLEVNSLGCPKCRPRHREDLLMYLEQAHSRLCPDCQRRSATNPLRVFDCKNEACQALMVRAPLMKHYQCPECASHLSGVLEALAAQGVPYSVNPYLVRGLDYYVRTTFEIKAEGLGAQSTVAAGGRYDGLVKAMGGPDICGVGMAIGLERVMLLLGEEEGQGATDVFIAALGEEARASALSWLAPWRRQGLAVQMSYEEKGLKAQMKQADKAGSRFVLIVGEEEMEARKLILRDMRSREQHEVPLESVATAVPDLLEEAR